MTRKPLLIKDLDKLHVSGYLLIFVDDIAVIFEGDSWDEVVDVDVWGLGRSGQPVPHEHEST